MSYDIPTDAELDALFREAAEEEQTYYVSITWLLSPDEWSDQATHLINLRANQPCTYKNRLSQFAAVNRLVRRKRKP